MNYIENDKSDLDELATYLPDGYNQVCLVLDHIGVGQREEQAEVIKAAIQKEFSNKSILNYYGLEREIYTPVRVRILLLRNILYFFKKIVAT